MKTFQINQKTITSEVKFAVKAIKQANRGLPKPVVILPYEIVYLPVVDHMALRVHYLDGNGKTEFFGIAI